MSDPEVRAAGGVVVRDGADGPEVAAAVDDWCRFNEIDSVSLNRLTLAERLDRVVRRPVT